ncbi:hypothetical protein, partial [Nostoc sp. NMS8]|uniref:hypothetical protein n=1 Tax=Nostoc sp. NMS8 TaxID=2815392 RepID=UPI0025D083CF
LRLTFQAQFQLALIPTTLLRASESQMAQFLEAIPVGIGIIDATGRPYFLQVYPLVEGVQRYPRGFDVRVRVRGLVQ